ncbi:hypothetical protein B9Z19DRAFT_1105025 [Tuber borchii]|uniref:Myb/SANT-like domain-containing protein n=1 Tax=Tuber borchii TaxID=42251 RepID=A0A2T7A7K7_TUBBO|nr:hypothetical protein B9Z19DRAFT_1109389 [Tuber borchii]PUU83714.1 hypothetical protein B9Z19DRAFT_1105025 [Tuber borchii]
MSTSQTSQDTGRGGLGQRATWSNEMEKTLIDGFLIEVRLGKRAENGFKKESYVRIMTLVNEAHQATIDIQQVKNKLALVHPKAREFKSKSLRFCQELHELFYGIRATGEFAKSPSTIPHIGRLSSSTTKLVPQTIISTPAENPVSDSDGEKVQVVASELGHKAREQIRSSEYDRNLNDEEDVNEAFAGENSEKEQSLVLFREEKRKRERSGDDSVHQAGSVNKKPVRNRISAGHAVAQALDRIGNTALTVSESRTEIAARRLQEEYGHLEPSDQLLAFQLFENVRKAELFVAMHSGPIRDLWLNSELEALR